MSVTRAIFCSFSWRRRSPALLFGLAAALSTVCAVVVAGSAAAALPAGCSEASDTVTCTFSSTGSEQTFTVPGGGASVDVVAVGAPGGTSVFGGAAGGRAAVVAGDLSVTPGETLYVEVGGSPTSSGCYPSQPCNGGFNGGGSTPNFGTGGGGASDVRTTSNSNPNTLSSRLLVAAGGGGGGDSNGPCAGGAGGDAGASGTAGASCGLTGGGGGGAGTASAGGTGGSPGGGTGSLGIGGSTGEGGAGGGGLYGGGGGGDNSASPGVEGGGGGGGGGSNLVPPGGSASTDTTGVPAVTISYAVAAVQVSPSALSFPTQAQSTISASQAVTITNTGLASLVVTGLTFTGTDPQDYLITSNGCLGPIAPAASCQVGVDFVPQAQGARSASLLIASNDPNSPASVPLSGTGGQLPQGPPGQTGATGPQGPAGKVELITCHTITKTVVRKVKGKRRKVHLTQKKCTGRVVSGTVSFTIAGAAERATISRGRTVYARGASVSIGRGRSQLVLDDLRPLRRGRYTLTLTTRHGHRRLVARRTITIA
jgi:hypothetical protein